MEIQEDAKYHVPTAIHQQVFARHARTDITFKAQIQNATIVFKIVPSAPMVAHVLLALKATLSTVAPVRSAHNIAQSAQVLVDVPSAHPVSPSRLGLASLDLALLAMGLLMESARNA